MDAKELRLGNLVLELTYDILPDGSKVPDLELSETIILTIDILKEIFDGICDYSAIPLTEEWLLKLGFYHWKTDEGEQVDYFKHDGFFPQHFIYYLPYKNLSLYIGNIDVKYVHQLQNLYFALTGKELTIK